MSSNIGDNRANNNTGNTSTENSNDNNNVHRTKKETLSLKVAEAEQRDVGRKIVRMDPEIAERLNITSGFFRIIIPWKED
ncbi:MAG: Cell division protein 48 N-terminal domain [Nitrososphaeraceae archaeon]|nr:Cell division protein 48 N-terminal domain [Nitrososphaeraceae archaeon]